MKTLTFYFWPTIIQLEHRHEMKKLTILSLTYRSPGGSVGSWHDPLWCVTWVHPAIATFFVLLSTPNRSVSQHGGWDKPCVYLHSVSRPCCIVQARELVLLYKWVGWIRRGGGEVDVCEWIVDARMRESKICTGTRRESGGVLVTTCRVG